MQRLTAASVIEGMLVDRVRLQPTPEPRPPVSWLTPEEKAAELDRIERNRARDTAREADLILGMAEDCPEYEDPAEGTPGARSRIWRKTEPEFPGVSEFFVDEVAHALNLGRGTAAFRARRAFTWRDNLPRTFRLLHRGDIGERRAGVLADVLQHVVAELAQAVEAALLPEACDLSPSRLKARALQLLAVLDAAVIDQRREEARNSADVRAGDTGCGMASLTGDMSAEEAAACYEVIDQLATMAEADGDTRPIGAIRSSIMSMLILRPADNGLPGVTVHLTVRTALEGLEGVAPRGGDVNGFALTDAHVRGVLRRFGAVGLSTPDGGTVTVEIADQDGRLVAAVGLGELGRLAEKGCGEHPDGECSGPVLAMPEATGAYAPTERQKTFVRTRDRTCRMPNCGQRVGWADLDHVVPHSCGGETGCTNLCCLCRSHHRLKTFARGWTFVMDDDGTLHVTSPAGVTRTTRPPGLRPREPEPSPDDPPPF